MNEEQARELISRLTTEEQFKLFELLSALRRKPAPAPAQ